MSELIQPNFIIIGSMKCATTTLHDQLSIQPGFFMCEPKEPNFFSDDDVYMQGEEWYSSLFGSAEKKAIIGESSTHYTKLPTWPNVIPRMDKYGINKIKIIYLIRHPIDRLVSHYIHEWSQGVVSKEINEAVFQHPEFIEYSKYFSQISPYINRYGKNNILLLSFDALKNSSQNTLEKVCEFLGYELTPRWDDELKQRNVSSERVRKFPLYDLLIEASFTRFLRRALIPKAIRAKVRGRLTLKERPILSEDSIRKLEGIFNSDLSKLSEMLNVDIDCKNFKIIGKMHSLDWKLK